MHRAMSEDVDRVIQLGLSDHALSIVEQAGLKPYSFFQKDIGRDYWYIDPDFTPEQANGYGSAARVAIAWCIQNDLAFNALIAT